MASHIRIAALLTWVALGACHDSSRSSDVELESVELPNPGEEEETKKAVVKSDASGILVASVSAESDKAQVVDASPSSAVGDASVVFGIGSLQRGIDVRLEEGESLEAESAALGLGGVLATAPALVVTASDPEALLKKMTIRLPSPSASPLSDALLVVLFKVIVGNQSVIGVVPPGELTLRGGLVEFYGQYFGSYQTMLVSMNEPDLEALAAKSIPAQTPIRSVAGVTYTPQATFQSEPASSTALPSSVSCTPEPSPEIPTCVAGAERDCIVRAPFQAFDPLSIDVKTVLQGATVAGVEGTLTLPAPSDVRIGVEVGTKLGKLKVNCRNTVADSIYDAVGLPDLSASLGAGSDWDWWDTVDDSNALSPNPDLAEVPNQGVSWSQESRCVGSEIASSLEHSPSPAVPASTFNGTASTQDFTLTYFEPIASLFFTNLLDDSADNWPQAVAICDALNDGHQGGDKAGSNWRLPTQKELMQLYVNGLAYSQLTATSSHDVFWSATTYSAQTTDAWTVNVAEGLTSPTSKANATVGVFCVHEFP